MGEAQQRRRVKRNRGLVSVRKNVDEIIGLLGKFKVAGLCRPTNLVQMMIQGSSSSAAA